MSLQQLSTNRIKTIGLPLLIFILALLPRVLTLGGTFITTDEPLFWQWSNEFTTALVNFDLAGTLVGKGYPYITVNWVHSLGLFVQFSWQVLWGQSPSEAWQHLALDQPFTFALLGPRRLTIGIANTLLILLIYLQAEKLLGLRIAFLGAGLMAFAPFLLGDSRTMRGDAIMSSLMLLSVFLFIRFLQEKRWGLLLTSAVCLGFAILTKIAAVPVVGVAGLAVLVMILRRYDRPWLERLRWGTTVMASWGAMVGLTLFIFWPALWVSPLAVFELVRGFAASAIDGRTTYFLGQLFEGDNFLPLFYPISFLFRAHPIVILGVLIVAALTVVSSKFLVIGKDVDSQSDTKQNGVWGSAWLAHLFTPSASLDKLWRLPLPARWTLMALGAYSLIYSLALNEGALKRDRYLMPVFPAAMFVAAMGLLWGVQWLAARWPGSARLPVWLSGGRWAWFLFFVLLGAELTQTLSTHPFYYTYWSPLLGGGSAAMTTLWAEGGIDSAAVVRLARQPDAAEQTISLINIRDFAPAFPGKTVRLVNNSPWVTSDHIILRQYHFQTEKMDPTLLEYLERKSLEFTLELQGYTWAYVYNGPAAQYYVGSTLDGKAELLGYTLSSDHIAPDQPLDLKLFWRNKGYQAPEKFYVRLVSADAFIWAETSVEPLPEFTPARSQFDAFMEGTASLSISPGTPPGLYFLKIGLTGGPEAPDVGEFVLPSESSHIVVDLPASPLTVTPAHLVHQPLGSQLTLLGYDLKSPYPLSPPTPYPLTLYWQVDQPLAEDHTVRLELVDAAEETVADWSGPLARGIVNPATWAVGHTIFDPRLLTFAAETGPQLTPGTYTWQVTTLDPAQQSPVTLQLGSVEIIDRIRHFARPASATALDISLGETIGLVGYDLSQAPLTGGARFVATLYWQTTVAQAMDYTVFTQILGPDGTVVGQHDGVPANGLLPTSHWDVAEVVADPHQIDISFSQTGEYRLIVGMYDPVTGVRLSFTADGQPLGDFYQLYTFTAEATR